MIDRIKCEDVNKTPFVGWAQAWNALFLQCLAQHMPHCLFNPNSDVTSSLALLNLQQAHMPWLCAEKQALLISGHSFWFTCLTSCSLLGQAPSSFSLKISVAPGFSSQSLSSHSSPNQGCVILVKCSSRSPEQMPFCPGHLSLHRQFKAQWG